MKLKIILICLLTIGFLTSCKSKKQVVHSQPKTAHHKVVERTEGIAQIETKKEIKSTIFSSTEDYIKFFKDAAIEEMRIYKIPASITLAQGILESGKGKSQLALKSKNHFGIKCHSNWTGERVYHDDDEKGECFRKYKFVATSYNDHSLFLTQRKRYAFLFDYDIKNYKKWAYGLRKAGYATDRKYPSKLLKIIEDYHLYEFDDIKKSTYSKKFKEVNHRKSSKSLKAKSKRYEVEKGDTLYAISRKFSISVAELKALNNLTDNTLSLGQKLIVQE